MKQTLLIAVLAGLLVGCSSLRVTTDYAEGTEFSGFRTFTYRDSDHSVAASSPLVHRRIVNAIKQGMTSSGLAEVDENPDVYVTYYGSTDQRTALSHDVFGSGHLEWFQPKQAPCGIWGHVFDHPAHHRHAGHAGD
jgi:hypothetical protein